MKETPPPELPAAARRVGDRFNPRARWLAELLSADLDAASAIAVERWAWEMIAYALTDERVSWQATGTTLDVMSSARRPKSLDELCRQAHKLWKLSRQCVTRLLDHEGAAVALLPASSTGAVVIQRHANGTMSQQIAGELDAAFPWVVANMLTRLGPKLRRCDPPHCSAFVSAVGHLKYHSSRCAQRAGMRRLRAERRKQRATGGFSLERTMLRSNI